MQIEGGGAAPTCHPLNTGSRTQPLLALQTHAGSKKGLKCKKNVFIGIPEGRATNARWWGKKSCARFAHCLRIAPYWRLLTLWNITP